MCVCNGCCMLVKRRFFSLYGKHPTRRAVDEPYFIRIALSCSYTMAVSTSWFNPPYFPLTTGLPSTGIIIEHDVVTKGFKGEKAGMIRRTEGVNNSLATL